MDPARALVRVKTDRILFRLVPFHDNRECTPDPVIIRLKARDL
jgi:hypothetical protein